MNATDIITAETTALHNGDRSTIEIYTPGSGDLNYLRRCIFDRMVYGINHTNLLGCLLKDGANPNWTIDYELVTPLMMAALFSEKPEYVDVLVKHGANVDAVDSGKLSPLMVAAGKGKVAFVDALLGHGADPNLVDDGGWPALSLAAYFGATSKDSLAVARLRDVCEVLLRNGAKVDHVVALEKAGDPSTINFLKRWNLV